MASAQVLPNSAASTRKQEHLQAGKKRLDEFRKKKAADRAKKAANVGQINSSDSGLHEKESSQFESVQRLKDSDGAAMSNGPWQSYFESSSIENNGGADAVNFVLTTEEGLLSDKHRHGSFSADLIQAPTNGLEIKNCESETKVHGSTSEHSGALILPNSELNNSSCHSEFLVMNELPLKGEISSSQAHAAKSSGLIPALATDVSPQRTTTAQLQTDPYSYSVMGTGKSSFLPFDGNGIFEPKTSNMRGLSSLYDEGNVQGTFQSNHSSLDIGERKPLGFATIQSSEFGQFNSDLKNSANQETPYSVSTEINYRRSRPSFLDSLNMPVVTSGSVFQNVEHAKGSFMLANAKSNGTDSTGTSSFQEPSAELRLLQSQSNTVPFDNLLTSSVSSSEKPDLSRRGINESSTERKNDFYSSKQNEDFAALEQHIEDLTQEKFSIQRALEASQTLVESLAAENSSLTDSYNQQRSVVNQLKSDMELLQEDVKARLLELESVKLEYANVLLECNAADERAKLLASEVIDLEEKALKLRSNELKLERQLENSEAEIFSFKKKMISLEKDRQDLQSTISALKEEKKLLQSKVRKASAGGNSFDANRSLNKKETSTSTEDLENKDTTPATAYEDIMGASSLGVDIPAGQMLQTSEVLSIYIPPDQMRMIENINTIISELALEKEELTQALQSELSHTSGLKELNRELSRQLEIQTQRLELLTSQSMVGENILARQPISRSLHDDTTYADEGDEVVERVLGWIMKLFPGGPSRRRTSKLL